MKKLLLSISIVAALFFVGCSKDDGGGGKSCETLANEYAAAAQAYMENDTAENCNEYKASLQAFIDKNCAGSSEAEAILQAQIDDLNCE